MILAGLQNSSLIDYPGKVACVAFLTGCNFTCPYCHNPELARGRFPQRIALDRFLAFLSQRRLLLDGVVVSGGEPTLNPDLPALCRAVKKLGLPVKLDTNGSRPDMLATLMDQHLVDYIAMDLKTDPAHYAPSLAPAKAASMVRESIDVILTRAPAYEFRTTCVSPWVSEATMARMAAAIQGARRYVLQTFRDTELLDPSIRRGGDPGLSPSRMERLQQIALPYVAACVIR